MIKTLSLIDDLQQIESEHGNNRTVDDLSRLYDSIERGELDKNDYLLIYFELSELSIKNSIPFELKELAELINCLP